MIAVGLGSSSLQLGTFLLIDLPIKIPEEEFIRLAFLPEIPPLPSPCSLENKKHILLGLHLSSFDYLTVVDSLFINEMISHLPLGFTHLF